MQPTGASRSALSQIERHPRLAPVVDLSVRRQHVMKNSGSRIVSGILWAIGLIPTTWFFFGPIAGFHHMYGIGITFYLVLNGEDPQPGDRMWGDYAVRFFPGRFAVGLVLWAISVFILFRLVRVLTRRRYTA